MAVSTMDGGSIATKRPLTPPAEIMDVDINVKEGAISDGGNIKDSSPNSALPTGNSTQATSVDDTESNQVNGVNVSAIEANDLAKKLNSEHSMFGNVGPLDPAQDHTLDMQQEGADQATLDSTSSVLQQPISDVREAPEPATSEQITHIERQKHSEGLAQDSELTNGSHSKYHQGVEVSVTTGLPAAPHSPPQPALRQPSVEPPSQILSSNQNQILESAASELSITTTDVPNHPPVPLLDGKMPEAPLDPAPSPKSPNEDLTHAPDTDPMSIDKQPPTVPQSPTKLSRPREDDGDEAPAAKRSKMEDEPSSANTEFKVPAQPGSAPITKLSLSTQDSSQPTGPITAARKKHLMKAIHNTKRSSDAKMFLVPVDSVLLNIPNYPNIVKNPMDLKTMEEKLKIDGYTSVQAIRADLDQIIENTTLFNGPDHPVTRNGYAMAKVFDRGMAQLPGPEIEEAPGNKKSRKSSLPAATKVAPPRRESRTSLPAASAPSPVTEQSPTFALGPQGIPLIRRDSSKLDGRPKREIHPPAPRDLPYANSKPKKKKYQAELKFCLHLLDELAKPKYQSLTYAFATPVDPVALNIPDYHSVIKKPMDLRTVREKLENGQYENAKEFEADVKLIFHNCNKYNGPEHPIRATAKELDAIFDREMSHKRSWIDQNTPVSGPQSPTSSDVEDEEEDEEEEEDAEEAAEKDQLSQLQRSIAEMSEKVKRLQQKAKSPQATGKKGNKSAKPDKKAAKKGSSAPPAKAEKKAHTKSSKKEQYVTYEQKQEISNRINSLSEAKMAKALKIIRDNMPNLKVLDKPFTRISLKFTVRVILDNELNIDIGQGIQDDELELDIDELSDNVLRKLSDFVKKNAKVPDEVPRPPAVVTASPAASRKKNKPMSKQEQERQIENLRERHAQFENPRPSIENAADACKFAVLKSNSTSTTDNFEVADQGGESSGDEDASEESEEE
ncbi:MAG: hypothetical protein Q9224_002619 [Gallowayella concinna]